MVDVRAKVARNVDYQVTVGDLQAWEARQGRMPAGAAVIAWTGCDRFWSARQTGRNYDNCGSGRPGLHQPGFSLRAVRWLIERGVLGRQGALGTDTFGSGPRRRRAVPRELAGLPPPPDRPGEPHRPRAAATQGRLVVAGGPRNRDGSGSPATVFGLVP